MYRRRFNRKAICGSCCVRIASIALAHLRECGCFERGFRVRFRRIARGDEQRDCDRATVLSSTRRAATNSSRLACDLPVSTQLRWRVEMFALERVIELAQAARLTPFAVHDWQANERRWILHDFPSTATPAGYQRAMVGARVQAGPRTWSMFRAKAALLANTGGSLHNRAAPAD